MKSAKCDTFGKYRRQVLRSSYGHDSVAMEAHAIGGYLSKLRPEIGPDF